MMRTWPTRTTKTAKPKNATDKKLRDAIAGGNVPASREAATLASFVAIFLAGSFLLAGNVAPP